MNARIHPQSDDPGKLIWIPSREDAALLLESSGDATFITDQLGHILAMNRMAEQVVGQTAAHVAGRSFHELMGCLWSPQESVNQCPLDHVINTGEPLQLVDVPWERADGIAYELSLAFWPRLQGTRRIGSVILCRDLTAAIEAQRDMARVARLAEDAPNPIVEFDAHGAMLYANASMVELVGACELYQQGMEALLPVQLPLILQECLTTQTAQERVEHTVGERVLAWSFFPIGDLGLVRAYGIDITADVALRRAKEAAEETARAKGLFLATMSHELRTPMNGVLGCMELLEDTSLTEDQRQLVRRMARSAEALLTLVNDVLDFSKIEAGKMTLEVVPVHVQTVVEDVVSLVSGMAKNKGLTLHVQVAPDMPLDLRGDPVRLRQILFNLIGNAIKFTESGSVTVSVQPRWMPPRPSGEIILEWRIQDSGIGMTNEQVSRLFQAYTQAEASTTRRFGGTGLGLMICRQLVELMSGEIGVESTLGQGTTFTFTTVLIEPVAAHPMEEALVSYSGNNVRPGDHPKILVVDDNEINRAVASNFLQKLKCNVETCSTGVEALSALAQVRYDAVLMDCEMPVMDGFEATRRVRQLEKERGTHTPIIALTGHASMEEADRCQQAGMDLVVTKPVTRATLQSTLEQLLNRPLA